MELETNTAGIPIRALGTTGTKVSIVGFGGGHYCRKHIDENTSVRLIPVSYKHLTLTTICSV